MPDDVLDRLRGVSNGMMMGRVAEAQMKTRDAKPISDAAARYAKKGLEKYAGWATGFWSRLARHIGNPGVVLE